MAHEINYIIEEDMITIFFDEVLIRLHKSDAHFKDVKKMLKNKNKQELATYISKKINEKAKRTLIGEI